MDQFRRSSILGGGAAPALVLEAEVEALTSASGRAVKDAPRWWCLPVRFGLVCAVPTPGFGVEKAASPREAERACEPKLPALAADGGVGTSGRGGTDQAVVA